MYIAYEKDLVFALHLLLVSSDQDLQQLYNLDTTKYKHNYKLCILVQYISQISQFYESLGIVISKCNKVASFALCYVSQHCICDHLTLTFHIILVGQQHLL